MIQKYERKDPFPQIPFADEGDIELAKMFDDTEFILIALIVCAGLGVAISFFPGVLP